MKTITIIKDIITVIFIVWVLTEPSVNNAWTILGIIMLFSSYKSLK